MIAVSISLLAVGVFPSFVGGSLHARSITLRREAEKERARAHALFACAVAARLEVRRKSGAKEVVIPGRVLPS